MLTEPAVPDELTFPATCAPFTKNFTVPPGAAPKVGFAVTTTVVDKVDPTVMFAPGFGVLIVVGASVMLYVLLAELALKLLSPE